MAIKPHMHCHDSWLIGQQGAHYNTDTTNYENMHISCAKNAYSNTSRRYSSLLPEMAKNIQSSRLARSLRKSCTGDSEDITIHKRDLTGSTMLYETKSNVIYEASINRLFQEELVYVNGRLQTLNRGPAIFLSPNTTLVELYDNLKKSKSTIVQEFMRRFQAGDQDFNMYLHKHFKLDASCYGIPLCLLNCYSRTPGSTDFRFDWVKIQDDIPVQLCALVRLQFKSKPLFLYLGLECVYINDTKNVVPAPFPTLTYRFTYNGQRKHPKLLLDKVDGIFEPAFVVPVNILSEGYLFSNARKDMLTAKFYAPPLQFLCRDGYGNMDFEDQLHNTVRKDDFTRAYLRKGEGGRERMYLDLLETLKRNGVGDGGGGGGGSSSSRSSDDDNGSNSESDSDDVKISGAATTTFKGEQEEDDDDRGGGIK